MERLINFSTNEPDFSAAVKAYASGAMLTIDAAFEAQLRELCARLMKLTPPLSGQSIKRSLWSRNIESMASYKSILLADTAGDAKAAFERFSPFRDPDIEESSAKQIGERRVERDIRKVIKGIRGAALPAKPGGETVIVSQTNPRSQSHDVTVDWGVRQKCQGRDAVRIYADRSGNVYGVDTEKFMPNATEADLDRVHQAARGKRGRVTTAASKDLVVGRWRWLNVVVAPADRVQSYIEKKKLMVGQGRGGWAAGFAAFGGKISSKGWVGRHMGSGSVIGWPPAQTGVINVTIINNSAWASNGDPDRVIDNALVGRQRDMEKLLDRILEKRWGEGASGVLKPEK